MAVRTTAEEIGKIIDLDETISDLDPFINAANELVNEYCAVISTYTETRLTLIETWLAAHFYAIRDPRAASESVGVGASYQYKVDLNLSVTTYGQQAMLLDTAGGLAALSKRSSEGQKKASFSIAWMGTEL